MGGTHAESVLFRELVADFFGRFGEIGSFGEEQQSEFVREGAEIVDEVLQLPFVANPSPLDV